jgi:hypothetical protein
MPAAASDHKITPSYHAGGWPLKAGPTPAFAGSDQHSILVQFFRFVNFTFYYQTPEGRTVYWPIRHGADESRACDASHSWRRIRPIPGSMLRPVIGLVLRELDILSWDLISAASSRQGWPHRKCLVVSVRQHHALKITFVGWIDIAAMDN